MTHDYSSNFEFSNIKWNSIVPIFKPGKSPPGIFVLAKRLKILKMFVHIVPINITANSQENMTNLDLDVKELLWHHVVKTARKDSLKSSSEAKDPLMICWVDKKHESLVRDVFQINRSFAGRLIRWHVKKWLFHKMKNTTTDRRTGFTHFVKLRTRCEKCRGYINPRQ